MSSLDGVSDKKSETVDDNRLDDIGGKTMMLLENSKFNNFIYLLSN